MAAGCISLAASSGVAQAEDSTSPIVIPIQVGFYDIQDGSALSAQIPPDGPVVDFVTLGEIKIVPPIIADVPAPEQAISAEFAQGVALTGYELRPTDTGTHVTLWWAATQPLDDDYTVFVHLLDEAGNIIVQSDVPPQTAQGGYPTSFWGAGETIVTEQLLPTADLAQGRLVVGLYRPSDFGRLAVLGETTVPNAIELGHE